MAEGNCTVQKEQGRTGERSLLMLDGIPSPAWLISRERRILSQNKAAESMFGTKPGAFCWESIHGARYVNEGDAAIVKAGGPPPPGMKCFFCLADEALAGNSARHVEVELDDGIWDTWWIPLGEDIYLHYAIDVTGYKKMEETLRQREAYLQLLLSSLPVGVIVVDSRTCRIEEVNDEAADIMGAGREEIAGRVCFDFFPGSGGRCPVIDSQKEISRAEMVLRRADGTEITVLKTVRRLHTGQGDKLVEAFTDITENKRLEERLYCLSITDPLTGAYNYRYFARKIEEEIERVRRNGNQFSLIMLDLDRFKSINDRFGHQAGDLVLQKVVETIKNRIRKIDVLARWGGEEFVILLPDTGIKNAASLAEELRIKLSGLNIPGVGKVTASFGVAGYCPGDTADQLLNRADRMMYEAKATGRNCVRCALEAGDRC